MNTTHPGKLTDMMMLVGASGEERAEAEYASLLDKGDSSTASMLEWTVPVRTMIRLASLKMMLLFRS